MLQLKIKKSNWKKNAVRLIVIAGLAAILTSCYSFKAFRHYDRGNTLIREGKYKEAGKEFEKAVSLRPDFEQAWTNWEYAVEKSQSDFERFHFYTQLAKINPNNPKSWNYRGLLRFDLKQYEAALREYEQAIAVDPSFYRAWFNKGQVLLKLGQPEAAISATRQVLKLQPDYFLAWTQICQALYELEDYQDALAHCEKSLDLNPDYSPTTRLLEKVTRELNAN